MGFFKAIGKELKHFGHKVGEVIEEGEVAVGIKDKDKATYKVNADGSFSSNVDLEDYKGDQKAKAQKLVDGEISKLEETKAQLTDAKKCGDTDKVAQLKRQLDKQKKEFTKVKWELEHPDIDLVDVAAFVECIGACGCAPIFVAVEVARHKSKINERLDDAAKAAGDTPSAAKNVEATDGSSSSSSTKSSSSTSSTKSSSSTGGLLDADPATLVRMMSQDPKAFFDKLNKLDPKDRAQVMMEVQTELQQENQLTSMMSNFLKSMHDTQKAVISNMRV